MSLRLLVICSSLGVGGAQRQLVSLVPRLVERGFEPIVRTLRSRGQGHFFEDLVEAGISTDCVHMRSRWNLAGARRAYRLWRLRPDVVFTQSVDAQVIGQLIARRLDIPHITTHHSGPGILRGSHRKLMTRMLAPHVDRVIAVSGVQIPELEDLGYRHEAVRLLPNGVAAAEVTRPRETTRAELGFDDGQFVASLVATLRPEKQVHVFLKAVARAHEQNPRIRGLVAGGGEGLDDARALAAQAGDVVLVLGRRSDIPDLLNASDCLCLSSDSEALPLSVIEAMSLAKPIVSTGVGGIPDAVVDGQTGLLVPPRDPVAFADALLSLAADPPRTDAMGLAGYRRFEERFTVERMVDGYVDAIMGAVQDHAPGRR
jgi:glycosyltransferase involved in cell wall biosynthesis